MLGMVGAMLVLLVVVGVFVAVRSFLRTDLDVKPTPVDYLAAVDAAQANGIEVFYPSAVPEGWVVTSVKLPSAAGEPWGLGMLTDDASSSAYDRSRRLPRTWPSSDSVKERGSLLPPQWTPMS